MDWSSVDWIFIIEALLSGWVIGFLICFTGVGGGVLVVPAISFFFDLPISVAVGTASAYTALTKALAGAEHVRMRNVNYNLFLKMSISAIPGILIAAGLVNYWLLHYPDSEALLQKLLRAAVIIAIVLSLVLIVFRLGEKFHSIPRYMATLVGGIIGLMMGATGVGGGVLIIPALLLIGREAPKRVVGTSILIALALSALVAIIYAGSGQINGTLVIWMMVGSLFGIPLGGLLLRRVSQQFVHRCLLGLITMALLLMVFG